MFFGEIDLYGNIPALLNGASGSVSYHDLAATADALGMHMEPRQLMFLVCSNTVDSVTGYVAALRRGVVPVLINLGASEGMLFNLAELYRPKYFYAPAGTGSGMKGYVEEVRGGDYVLMRRVSGHDISLHPDLALLLPTSGSTGSPKLVRQSYANIDSNARAIMKYLDINETERAITTMPMGYTYGLSIINSHLRAGASIVVTEGTVMQKEFWETLRSTNATSFGGVPFTYEMLLRLRFERMQTPSLRYLTQAGGKLEPALVEKIAGICRDKGMRFIIMYGQAEATARMSYLPWPEVFTKPASIGIAIPGGVFRIHDENGDMVDKPGKTGELVYSGGNVSMGYAVCPEDLARGDDNDGVLHTGDLAYRDAEGYYYISGRKNRFLKIFGNRVSLDELERALKRFEVNCICAGMDNKLKIFVFTVEDCPRVERYLREMTTINSKGYSIHIIDEPPRNEYGKISYGVLNAWEE